MLETLVITVTREAASLPTRLHVVEVRSANIFERCRHYLRRRTGALPLEPTCQSGKSIGVEINSSDYAKLMRMNGDGASELARLALIQTPMRNQQVEY